MEAPEIFEDMAMEDEPRPTMKKKEKQALKHDLFLKRACICLTDFLRTPVAHLAASTAQVWSNLALHTQNHTTAA